MSMFPQYSIADEFSSGYRPVSLTVDYPSYDSPYTTRDISQANNDSTELLRFPAVQFSWEGKVRVCYCDASKHGGVCDKAEDFDADLGFVYLTQVKRLLNETKFHREECQRQLGGGLRCYEPALEITPDPLP